MKLEPFCLLLGVQLNRFSHFLWLCYKQNGARARWESITVCFVQCLSLYFLCISLFVVFEYYSKLVILVCVFRSYTSDIWMFARARVHTHSRSLVSVVFGVLTSHHSFIHFAREKKANKHKHWCYQLTSGSSERSHHLSHYIKLFQKLKKKKQTINQSINILMKFNQVSVCW